MGIYVSNRVFGEAYDYAAEIPANEAYDAAFGCAHILADRVDNDRALFESVIRSDIAEVMAIREGYEVVNEGVVRDVLKKIVEMFKKILAKIKGIFNAFLAKLAGAFKNGKDLVKKYEKQLLTYNGTWKKFKVKGIRKPSNGKTDIKSAITGVFANEGFGTAKRYFAPSSANTLISMVNNRNIDGYKKSENVYDADLGNIKTIEQVENADTEDIKTALLKFYIKNVNISDYKDLDEDIKNYLYEDEDTIDGDDENISGSYFSAAWIKTILQDDKWEKDVKKVNEKLEKAINNIIDVLNKTNENFAKWRNDNKDSKTVRYGAQKTGQYAQSMIGGIADTSIDKDSSISKGSAMDSSKFDSASVDYSVLNPGINKAMNDAAQKIIQTMQKIASNEQAVISDVTSKYMENVKFAMAQARKMWVAAAGYTSTMHKEGYEYDNTYVQAVAECAEEQFYTNMESIH